MTRARRQRDRLGKSGGSSAEMMIPAGSMPSSVTPTGDGPIETSLRLQIPVKSGRILAAGHHSLERELRDQEDAHSDVVIGRRVRSGGSKGGTTTAERARPKRLRRDAAIVESASKIRQADPALKRTPLAEKISERMGIPKPTVARALKRHGF